MSKLESGWLSLDVSGYNQNNYLNRKLQALHESTFELLFFNFVYLFIYLFQYLFIYRLFC